MNKERAASLLIEQGLAELDSRYGENGLRPKRYHSVYHTLEVMSDSVAMARLAAQRGEIDREDISLIRLAACYHDFEHDLPRGEAEARSAQVVMERMQRLGAFGVSAIAKTGSLIVGTTVKFVEDKLVQAASSDYAEQILADADLAPLGKPFRTFWDRTVNLFSEELDPRPFVPDRDFYIKEAKILKGHQFYTREAKELFPHQQENILKLEQLAEAA